MFERVKLYLCGGLYDHTNTDVAFVQAVKRNVRYHQKHCRKYDAILKKMDFKIDTLESAYDLHKLPTIPTMY